MKLQVALLTTNFSKGRKGTRPIDVIVVHVTEGSMASVKSWFNNPAAQASAHYCIGRDGAIVQFVKEEDTAWHAGRVHEPTAILIKQRPNSNPNSFSIGIEHEGTGKQELTDAQRASSILLIREIARRYSIPIDRAHIVGHREIFARKTCPGKIDVGRLVQEARSAAPAGLIAQTRHPRIVYSDHHKDYLIVTKYVTDDDWEFVTMKRLPPGVKAATPLSRMPSEP